MRKFDITKDSIALRNAAAELLDNGPIQMKDGSVLRLDPPLPFDHTKPLLLDGEPLLRRLLSLDGVPLVIADTVFVVSDERGSTYARYHVSCLTNEPEFEVDFLVAYGANGSALRTVRSGRNIGGLVADLIADLDGVVASVLRWTRRPGEKYATPERVWPEGE